MQFEGDKKIIWLASYPKSGNTWFRVLLSNYLNDDGKPMEINNLFETPIASSRNLFDEITGVPSSDLTHEEIDRLRPSVYEYLAKNSNDLLFHKVHDAYTYNSEGRPLFPESVSRAAIYIIRNPLDVAVSFSYHLSRSMDFTIDKMNDPAFAFCEKSDKMTNQLRQKLLTWSEHVKSWTDGSSLKKHIIRYEDLKKNPYQTFKEAIGFIGLELDEDRLEWAVAQSDFTNLRNQEEEKGFHEKAQNTKFFFRKGMTGSWKEELSEGQIKKVIENQDKMMQKFGYLEKNYKIVC